MADTDGISWGVDLYRVMVFPLNTDGSLQAVDDTPYEGLQFEGSRAFEITPAEARPIENYGDGRLRDVIYLPPNTSVKGELRVGYDHQAINAALTGVKKFAVGESTMVARGTDQQGNEPMVALVLQQMAHDSSKLKRWRYYMIPRAQCIPLDSSFNENATEMRYQISMAPSTVHIWNKPLTLATEGCLEMAYVDGMSEGRIAVVAWQADGIETEYLFPTDKPAIDVDKIALYEFSTGLPITAGITKATTGITFTVSPPYIPDGLIVAKYEW